MKYENRRFKIDIGILVAALFLIVLSIAALFSIAPFIFPTYFVYFVVAVIAFIVFSQIEFEVLSLFRWHLFIGSILFLMLPLLIGQVTRGAVRWIPIGSLTIQPAELVRPFIFLLFANFLTEETVTLKRLVIACGIFLVPFGLIVMQPSLGVGILLFLGFVGIILASGVDKRLVILGVFLGIVLLPLLWNVLAPYQKARILGEGAASYNSIQSMISVGSGRLLGRGLGKGVQTQLAFLPERHTDFIFASIAEELGFVGAGLTVFGSFFLLFRISGIIGKAKSFAGRAFVAGVFLSFFAQTVVHIGMNMGLLPITGVPLPLVSAGGSSLVASAIALGMVIGAKK